MFTAVANSVFPDHCFNHWLLSDVRPNSHHDRGVSPFDRSDGVFNLSGCVCVHQIWRRKCEGIGTVHPDFAVDLDSVSCGRKAGALSVKFVKMTMHYALLTVLAVVVIYPLWYAFVTSFMTASKMDVYGAFDSQSFAG